ncbi:MAG: hypothetical protein JRE64_04725 [Deltaproteobacteria bacterium]|nr:hypothetical protein [Deltaproteobacteria bacterium]
MTVNKNIFRAWRIRDDFLFLTFGMVHAHFLACPNLNDCSNGIVGGPMGHPIINGNSVKQLIIILFGYAFTPAHRVTNTR